MRTLAPLLLLALFALPVQAQLPTTNLDSFDRPDSTRLGETPTAPTTLSWTEKGEEVGAGTTLTSDSTVRRQDEAALLQSGATEGQKWATVDMSSVSGYPTTLDDASGVVTWAFNMRQNGQDPDGFSAGEYGLMFVLASSSNGVPGSGNAYAVVLGQDDTADNLKLVSFNGGYSGEGEFTDIVTWSADLDTDYLSVRVTFDADTKTWTLYAENGASSYPRSDPRNVTAERGSAQNGDLTGDGQKYVGILRNHGTDDTAKAFFDDIYVTDPNGALPVELAAFEATADDDDAHLRWTTAAETRNAGFEVQHATKRGFETITFVEGAGTTSEPTQYAFTVEDLASGTHTFRLKQVDLDGSTSLGPTRVVKLRPQGVQLVPTGPNPVRKSEAAAFRLVADAEQTVTATLHDALGRTVRTLYDGRVGAQGKSLSVSAASLSAGVYFVRVQGSSVTTTRRLTVVP